MRRPVWKICTVSGFHRLCFAYLTTLKGFILMFIFHLICLLKFLCVCVLHYRHNRAASLSYIFRWLVFFWTANHSCFNSHKFLPSPLPAPLKLLPHLLRLWCRMEMYIWGKSWGISQILTSLSLFSNKKFIMFLQYILVNICFHLSMASYIKLNQLYFSISAQNV